MKVLAYGDEPGPVDTAVKVATLRPTRFDTTSSAEGLRAGLHQFGRFLLDIAFPPSCLACRTATEHQDALCASCWRSIGFIERPFCERLGTPFTQDLGEGLLSPEAIARPPAYFRARAVARFEDGPARMLVHRLKYGDRLELARPMGRWMARAGAELLAEADVMVAVPLHRRRLWIRGFNQAVALADEVSRLSGVAHRPFGLERVKSTPSQVGMSRSQRLTNMQGAFRVPQAEIPAIARKSVLLVDDVLTTGATLDAAARSLLRAGAHRVDVLVFARVVTPGR